MSRGRALVKPGWILVGRLRGRSIQGSPSWASAQMENVRSSASVPIISHSDGVVSIPPPIHELNPERNIIKMYLLKPCICTVLYTTQRTCITWMLKTMRAQEKEVVYWSIFLKLDSGSMKKKLLTTQDSLHKHIPVVLGRPPSFKLWQQTLKQRTRSMNWKWSEQEL